MSAQDPHPHRRADVGGIEMAYVDTGSPHPNPLPLGEGVIVFLHGNPTSSYLWRNIIPHVSPLARCLAPDLMGMGESDATPDGSYRFADHSRYLDAWFDATLPDGPVTLVVHDWGSALGFHWARRHPERVRGLVYMEAIVRPVTWDEWPEAARQVFQGFRSEAGESMVLERNIFVERVLPGSTINGISDEAMGVYRRRYADPGESRRPTLSWPREIPIEGEPPDVVAIVAEYAEWLSQTLTPKLFVNAEPGAILTGPQREFCRTFTNQREVTVPGVHFIQEDSPHEIGAAIAEWYAGL
ncbi:MAG: haloalkane dehalogenase [Chloroflexi bacterium]|nr:haloalkane dehalogenase [Chloroflexota bacterium]